MREEVRGEGGEDGGVEQQGGNSRETGTGRPAKDDSGNASKSEKQQQQSASGDDEALRAMPSRAHDTGASDSSMLLNVHPEKYSGTRRDYLNAEVRASTHRERA